MQDIEISVMHHTDGRVVKIILDSEMTSQEVIGQLIANDFIKENPQGYDLAVQGGQIIRHDQSLSDAGVKIGDKVRVIPATDAGCKQE